LFIIIANAIINKLCDKRSGMENTIQEITKRYLEERNMQEFANGLGIKASRQAVHHWKEGNQLPSMMTLLSVLASPTAEGWAKAWAGECSAILLRQTVKN
jgi:hypothetical protein